VTLKTIGQNNSTTLPKPFLKWAGGKTQLINTLVNRLPLNIKESHIIDRYIEPFLGGGAFFFYLKRNYSIKESIIVDINPDLIISYKTIQHEPEALIQNLEELQTEFLSKELSTRKIMYYKIREQYNKQKANFNYNNFSIEWVKRASFLIFLNKTCYNGLFRHNSRGEFNVPFGDYKKPQICDSDNILKIHKSLQDTIILKGDFSIVKKYCTKNTFVYLDPPYRPINNTSNFKSYSKENFTDDDQIRLSEFFIDASRCGCKILLSNSDPQNENPTDTFFQDLYNGYEIQKVKAIRMINCNGEKRGFVNEIIINNYVGVK
jgi:DNA adenine methylase